jgi:hypothetical protein
MSGKFGKTMGELMVEQAQREARLAWFGHRLGIIVLLVTLVAMLKYLFW